MPSTYGLWIRVGLLWVTVTFVCGNFAYGDQRFGREQLDFFENRIRPALADHCYRCHSDRAKELKAGLRLDSRENVLRGGDSGKAIIIGHANRSLLIKAIRHESLQMPPGNKLPEHIIADFEKWVDMGAPAPTSQAGDSYVVAPVNNEDHWAFRSVVDPRLPAINAIHWPYEQSDRFILSALERAGISPVENADRYTWLRRVCLDLTGLPPTNKQIASFAGNQSSESFERTVDRLLTSPAYGERWARHWLDLVGYADEIGTSNNVFAEHAWRYRDYVIQALNRDKPFDRFIREQIAGDLLQYESVEEKAAAITATGFLVLGDLEIVEADKVKMRVDIVDQQLAKTSKAFLGMTVSCARCHDHKFDPISQRDYYAMAGFFYSTDSVYKTDRGVWSDVIYHELPESDSQIRKRHRQSDHHQQVLASWKVRRDQLLKQNVELGARLKQDNSNSDNHEQLQKKRESLSAKISQFNRKIAHAEFFAPRVPRTYGVRDSTETTNMRITIRGNPRALGEEVPRGFLHAVARNQPSEVAFKNGQSGRRELANWIAAADNPLTARVAVNRIWQKLFGTGLVPSVDYFGVRSDAPTHPELLDHLASRFIRDGWSQKSLIRSLVLSRTYRLSSAPNDLAQQMDPQNRLYWRMHRRRLDAEALRDSMLAVSGQLHISSGGPSLPLEYPENVVSIDPKNVNPPSFSLKKWREEHYVQRTVYLPIVRSAGQPGPAELRNIFDFTQPAAFAGQRATTAVPTQALFLMNSSQVKRHAANLAALVQNQSNDSATCLAQLWLRTLNRPITEQELEEAVQFIEDDETKWCELCHALLATNEFLMRL